MSVQRTQLADGPYVAPGPIRPPRSWSWANRIPAWWPAPALGLLLALAAGLIVYETRGTFFWADEWEWILHRRGGGLDSLLQPHNQHFSLLPVLLYKLLFALVGLRHYWPYRAVMVTLELAGGSLMFLYARQRVGSSFALLAAALILFFGPGWQDILWPFQSAWILTVWAGVAALIALDRGHRRGDIAACVLLGISLASASPGLAIAAGLTVEVLLRRRPRDLWIVAIPIVLYALWWVTYQHTEFNRHTLVLVPHFMFAAAGGALSALTGLAHVDVYSDKGDFLSWGAPLLVLGLVAGLWRLRRLGRIPPRVVSLTVILLAFWLLTGIGRAYVSVGSFALTSTGTESRYLFVGAVFIVLLFAELVTVRAREAPLAAGVAGVLVGAAVLSNLGPLQDAAGLLRNQARYTEAELSSMNLTRKIIAPGYVSNGFIFGIVTAGGWFAAERALGAPPLSEARIAGEPDFARQAADSQFIKLQHLTLAPAAGGAIGPVVTVDGVQTGTTTSQSGCVRYRPSAYSGPGAVNALEVTVPSAGLQIRAGGTPATVSLRRYSLLSEVVGTIAPESVAALRIRADLAAAPWHAQISAPSPFTVCGSG